MITIYFVRVQRIDYSKNFSVLTTILFFINLIIVIILILIIVLIFNNF